MRRLRGLLSGLATALVTCVIASGADDASAQTYGGGSGAAQCSACHVNGYTTASPYSHGVAGESTPAKLPSQGSDILDAADLTDSCNPNTNCSLRTTILGYPTMGATVSNAYSAAALEAVRSYLYLVLYGNVQSSPSFTSTATGYTSTSTVAVTINNYRGNTSSDTNGPIGYSFSLESTSDFDFASAPPSGTCAATGSTSPHSCTVYLSIRFKPQAAGTRTTHLRVALSSSVNTDPAPGISAPGRTDIVLSGTGLTPTPTFSASSTPETFNAKLGSTSSASVTISNPGTAALALGTISYSNAQYALAASSTCASGGSVAAGSSCVLTTVFTPTSAGTQNATLSIPHNAGNTSSPFVIALNGTATQSLISPTSSAIDFLNTQFGVPKTLNQVVTNTGTANLVFSVDPSSAAALSGADKAAFGVGGTCTAASPLAPGANCTLAITFTPSQTAHESVATLTISSDATNGPLVIALQGAGVALPEPVLTFPTSDFPDTVIGQTSTMTRTVTIHNDRTRGISYSVANVTDFNVGGHSCSSHDGGLTHDVPGGGTCTVTVQFVPTLGSGEGRRQGTLTFTFTGTGGDADPSSKSGAVAGMSLLPLSVSATSLNAAAIVGTPSTVSVVLTNRSSSSLTLSSLGFSGAAAGDYAVDPTSTCNNATVLSASANCTLVVRFAPALPGTRNAVLTITHTALGSPQTVQLLGTATPAPQGRIELSATSLSFADTQLGSTSAQTVTIVNSGNLALDFSAFTVAGTAAAEFTRSGTCAVGTPVPIAGQCTLVITFAPTALGLQSASIAIASDASNGTATLALGGNGVPVPAPQVVLTPATLDFGNQTTGGLYPSRRVHVANSGTADLTIASIVVAGQGFSDVSATACPAVLAAGSGCDVDIALVANSAVAYTGTLTVTDDAAGSPHVAALRGTGVASALPVLVWAPAVTTLDFGQVSAGSVSSIQSLTLSNQGPGGVNLTVLNAVGADGAAFSVVGGTCSLGLPLFEGQTCRVDVVFAPGSAGAKTAAVQVASTGSFPPTVTLTGTGLAGPNPSLVLSTATVSFESTPVGTQSLPQVVNLVSTGSGIVTISAMAIDGPYAIQSTTCPSLPFPLIAGSQCSVSIAFRPTSDGTTGGTLRITSDAAPAERDVALSGSAHSDAATGSGGCTIGQSGSPQDPTLWALLVLAMGILLVRRRRAERAARSGPSTPHRADHEESAS